MRNIKTSSGDTTSTHPYVSEENARLIMGGNSRPEWEKAVIIRNEGKRNIWTELWRNGKLEYRLGVKPETK